MLSGKRVVLYQFDRFSTEGFVSGPLGKESLELITAGGNLHKINPARIKALCFISESGKSDLFTAHNLFERRPKLPGLWVRFTFRDGERLDGLLSHNMLEWPEAGYLLVPPRADSTRQRVFVPRLALVGTELKGIIGQAARKSEPSRSDSMLTHGQLTIFD